MGTTWSLQLANPEFRALDAVRVLVESVLQDVIAQMSNWQGDSVISRFNAAPEDSWHALPPAFSRVLAAAMQWAERSAGALDPTMGALVSLWGFGPRAEPLTPHSGQRPSEARIDAARAQCGFQRLDWTPGQARIRQPGGLQLDLCGIAKGFAVDAVVARLRH
ncbi:FAD:protein FMN transferase [bioreactor metagenome]|uniref:FAD:protein FMN transferase n=1 Tax=bioreactor metagenome TaxID=1076179 RepID=A0A645CB83_9ZZZZ